mgnify:FL=1
MLTMTELYPPGYIAPGVGAYDNYVELDAMMPQGSAPDFLRQATERSWADDLYSFADKGLGQAERFGSLFLKAQGQQLSFKTRQAEAKAIQAAARARLATPTVQAAPEIPPVLIIGALVLGTLMVLR